MSIVLTLLFLLSLALLVAGLIDPNSAKWLLRSRTSRKIVGLVIGGTTFVLFVGIGAAADLASESDQKPAPTPTSTPKVTPSPTLTPTAVALDENRKKTIYHDIVVAEDRAQSEADAKYPTEAAAIQGLSKEQTSQRLYANKDLAEQLGDKYRAELRAKYGITEQQQKDIVNEGTLKKWPMPQL